MDREKVISESAYFIEEVSPISVFVNGEGWSSANLATAISTDRVYSLDHSRGILKFGNGTTGYSPDNGSVISIGFTPERFLSDKSDEGYIGKLSFPTNGDQDSVIIKRFEPTKISNESLSKGAKSFRLKQQNIIVDSVLFRPSAGSVFTDEKTFIDGTVELLDSGDWSLDYESGILHSFDKTSSSADITISYKYNPVTTLTKDEWFFSGDRALKDTVVVKDTAWATVTVDSESVPSGVNKFSLSEFNIEPGTLSVTEQTPSAFKKEVNFVDGRTEILGLIGAAEVVPNGVLVGSGVKTFNLSLTPADTSIHVVAFSNRDVFNEEVPGVPDEAGEYNISGKVVSVYIDTTVTAPGNVTYFYQDPTKNPVGTYSVDYKLGDIYTYTPTGGSTIASFQFAHIEISYPIARIIPENDIDVDPEARTVLVNDREALRRLQIPSTSIGDPVVSSTYQVLYNYIQERRTGIEQLEPFFTPILKEYLSNI